MRVEPAINDPPIDTSASAQADAAAPTGALRRDFSRRLIDGTHGAEATVLRKGRLVENQAI